MGNEEQVLVATEEACRVYVGNLLPKAKEIHLTNKFAHFGTIHSVWIARKPPGFAFVRFASPDAAQRAVDACREDRAMEILGKAVRVQMAGDKDRKDQKQIKARNSAEKGDEDAMQSGYSGTRSSRRRESSDDSHTCVRRRSSNGGEIHRVSESERHRRRSRSRNYGRKRYEDRARSRSRSEFRRRSWSRNDPSRSRSRSRDRRRHERERKSRSRR